MIWRYLCAALAVSLTLGATAVRADPFTEKDLETWMGYYLSARDKGEKLFHDATLGSNNVSCDMCHPDGANTHPETYPKFQQQIGEVVGLREMINWCIENPLEGDPLPLDDERLIALEAYITWERRGVELSPGKH